MANNTDIQLILDNGGHIDYRSGDDLGINLNRIADDFQKPDTKFGDFSYTFAIPKTKNNLIVFEYPDTKGRTKIFVGKMFGCKLILNNKVLNDGVIKLTSITPNDLNVQFFSRLPEFVEAVADLNVADLDIAPIQVLPGGTTFGQGKIVADHIEKNYQNCDETPFQFPLVFYRTFHAPAESLVYYSQPAGKLFLSSTSATTENLHYMYVDWFNTVPLTGTRNFMFYHQFPPSFYMISLLRGIFESIGWELGGNFHNIPSIKKILLLYVGEVVTGSITIGGWDLNKYLPKVKAIDFLKNIIKTFNLYFTIDYDSKTFVLNDYETLYSGNANPKDITQLVDAASWRKDNVLDSNIQVLFKDTDNNSQFAGNNLGLNPAIAYFSIDEGETAVTGSPRNIFGLSTKQNLNPPYDSVYVENYNPNVKTEFDSKVTGTKVIQSEFAAPTLNTMLMHVTYNRVGSAYSGQTAEIYVSVPLMSAQTESDNKGYKFSEDSGSTFIENSPQSMVFDGEMTMMYYYGQAQYDWVGKSRNTLTFPDQFSGEMRDWMYVNIITGGTISIPTGKRVIMPVTSPYKLVNLFERNLVIDRLFEDYGDPYLSFDALARNTVKGMEVDGLMRTYMMAGRVADNSYDTTDFHLIFCEDEDLLFPTIYTKFHKPKYDGATEGYLFKAKMRMSETDYAEMSFNRTIMYDDELYRLVSIKNFNPIKGEANIELLKKI